MGARSNAILVSHDDNVIQACAYQVSSSTTVRPLQTGGTYYQPPSGGGIFSPSYKEGIDSKDFLSIFTARLQELDVTVEKSLVSCYRGMSPNIARRILDASNVDGLSMVKTLNSQDILNIFRHFCSWASIFDRTMIQRMHGLEYSVPSVITNPGMAEFGTKKIQEFYPITFITDTITAASAHNAVEASVVADVENVENVGNGIENKGINTSLKVSKFLLSFYSLYERKAAFQLLRASCEKKVSLRIKKAGKVLADFQEQEKDAKYVLKL
jgi:NFACT N-terminal and middle domains